MMHRIYFRSFRWIAASGLLAALLLLGCHGDPYATPPAPSPTPPPAPSPDPEGYAARLLFTCDGDLCAIHANGTGRRNLTRSEGYEGMPAWSPTGEHVAFAARREGNMEILVAPASAPAMPDQQLRVTDTSRPDMDPAWAPDGWHLAFATYRGNTWGIFVVGVLFFQDQTEPVAYSPTRLTYNMKYEAHPAWSPDGHQIAFTSDRGFRWQVMALDYQAWLSQDASSRPEPQPFPGVQGLASTAYPAWSPDGTRLALASTVDGNWEIYTLNVDGSDPRRLTHHPAQDWGPAWSPDGAWIAFASLRSGNGDLYLVRADGSETLRLTGSDAVEMHPAWEP